ncbi:MAG: hypothetical protein J07HQX50_01731, partial [Haloquadratum sp. J07HQX50]
KLGHDSVDAVDYRQSVAALLTDAEKQQLPDSLRALLVDPDSVAYPLPDIAERIEEEQTRLDKSGCLSAVRARYVPCIQHAVCITC